MFNCNILPVLHVTTSSAATRTRWHHPGPPAVACCCLLGRSRSNAASLKSPGVFVLLVLSGGRCCAAVGTSRLRNGGPSVGRRLCGEKIFYCIKSFFSLSITFD